MKRLFIFLCLMPLIFLLSCENVDLAEPAVSCSASNQSFNYDHATEIQNILNRYAALGVPGVSIGVKTTTQEWAGAAGFAKIEDRIPMQICHLQYAQSLSKTYTAVLVMMLYEDGIIKLDAAIQDYLPAKISTRLRGSNKVTVRMLLNHTSGIFDYAYDYSYVTDLLSNQDKFYDYHRILSYVYDKELRFEPGSKYEYCNTNYELLALIIDQVTGKDHGIMMAERIFKPAGLTQTSYRNKLNYLDNPNLVNCYLNRRSDNKIENVSRAQVNNVKSMIGDDGLVATPLDYVHFLEALRQGRLVKKETLDVMYTWVNDDKGKPTYGLGIDYTFKKDKLGFGHSGGGLGAGCLLYYFPEKDVTLFLGVNLGVLIEGPYTKLVEQMEDEILIVILR
ncbi:serine hydrolase domain-containing protein [Adhaeribacter arboris]|nr:serine hydrolase domain-containing protein [Adhaeribacter arboris]